MISPTITPLKKHRGQNGAIAALFVLVAAAVVVWTTHPKPATPPPDDPPSKPLARAAPASAPVAPTVEPAKTVAPVARSGKITASGVTGFDEKQTAHVVAPVRGWFDKVHMKGIGRQVRPGEVLASMYSVDVYMAELDLVAQVQQFTTQDLLSNARRRLQRWSMPKPMMEQVEKTGVARAKLPLIAPRAGTLVANHALPGLFVEPAEMFTITDPLHIWVFADFAEADAARLKVGTPAKLKIEGLAKPVTANVAYIYRLVDDGMRKARFELVTPKPIKPGASVEVEVTLD